jgi:hypothetical protein
MLKNKTNIIMVIMLAIILCLLILIFAFMIVREYLPAEIKILPITIPGAIPYPTYTLFPTFPLVPTITPTLGPQWTWFKLPLYNWNVEMPSGWTIALMNSRPEPTDPMLMGGNPMGHDCTDYQLISPDRLRFINITMPCGWGEGIGGVCPDDTDFVQAVGNGSYLIRRPSGYGFIYEISSPGTYEDTSGTHTAFFCMSQTAPVYLYWELGKENYWETMPNAEIDRIMLSLLTSNK